MRQRWGFGGTVFDRSTLIGGAAMLAMLAPAVLWLPAALQLVIPVGGLVAVMLALRPRESLLAIFGMRILADCLWWVDGELFGLNVMELFSGLVALVAGFLALQHLDRLQRHPFFLPFLAFCALMVLGAVRSADLAVMAEMIARFASPALLMFLVSVTLQDKGHRRALTLIIPLFGLVPFTLGFYHLAAGQMAEMELAGYGRLHGAYSDPHNHGHAMAVFATLGIFWMRWLGRSPWTVLALAYTVGCTVLMFLTYVRTSLTGLVVFLLVFLLRERLWKLSLAIAGVAVIAATGSAVVQDRFGDVFSLIAGDPTADTHAVGSGRLTIWGEAVERWFRRPLFDVLFGMGLDEHRTVTRHQLDTHNDYLALLLQMGPLALVVYLLFQGMTVLHAQRLSRATQDPWLRSYASYIIAFTAMVFVANLLSNSYVNRVPIAWLYWGLVGVLFAEGAAEARRATATATIDEAPRERRAG